MERRLAAILAADVVGYSRLIEADEAGTLAALKSHRESLIEPKIAQYHGRVVKLMGDGLLAEFPSAVEAVQCAVEIQFAIAERNLNVPEERRTTYRIGINIGDIVVENDDIFGDGVNIAARLEGLADPGGICISRPVHTQIADKLDLEFEDLGEQQVKNIAKPVMVYRVALDTKAAALVTPVVREAVTKERRRWLVVAAAVAVLVLAVGGALWWQPWAPDVEPASIEQMAFPLPDRPSIAVLPFTNMSGDQEQEYFSDGITEDLIIDLSKVSGLSVIARNSTFAYKGQSPDVRDVGQALNARYVVEGSVRKSGGRVRINAQLIDAETGNHLWADRYDRDFKDVFTLQDEVIGKIISALRIRLTPDEQRRLARHETDNAEAYDFYLQGLRQESFFTKEGNQESRRLFEAAISIDPNFAQAYSHLAQAYSLAQENDWLPDKEATARKAIELAEKAIQLDEQSPEAHWALARIVSRAPILDQERALAAIQRAVDLNPNFADGHAFQAQILNYVGRAEEGLGVIDTAIRINPAHPFWYVHIRGQSLVVLGRYEEAIESLTIAIERNPAVAWPRRWLLSAYGHAGRLDDAEWEVSELESLGQPPTIKSARAKLAFVHTEYIDHYLDGLRKAGVPEE